MLRKLKSMNAINFRLIRDRNSAQALVFPLEPLEPSLLLEQLPMEVDKLELFQMLEQVPMELVT